MVTEEIEGVRDGWCMVEADREEELGTDMVGMAEEAISGSLCSNGARYASFLCLIGVGAAASRAAFQRQESRSVGGMECWMISGLLTSREGCDVPVDD